MSVHTAYVNAIRGAQHFIYIENQYFLGSSFNWDSNKDIGEHKISFPFWSGVLNTYLDLTHSHVTPVLCPLLQIMLIPSFFPNNERKEIIRSTPEFGTLNYRTIAGANNLIPIEIALKIANKIYANERFSAYIIIPMWPEGNPTGTPTQRILYWQVRFYNPSIVLNLFYCTPL